MSDPQKPTHSPVTADYLFTYYKPTPEHVATLSDLGAKIHALAQEVERVVPAGPERIIALRKLHEFRSQVNFAIMVA